MQKTIKEQLAWQETPWFLASRGDWCVGAVGDYIKQAHSFSQLHWLSTKLSPRNQKETRIASKEWKVFDFEVGDGWKDLSPNLLQSNDFAETNVFTLSLNALLCSPCGFVSPKQLVVHSCKPAESYTKSHTLWLLWQNHGNGCHTVNWQLRWNVVHSTTVTAGIIWDPQQIRRGRFPGSTNPPPSYDPARCAQCHHVSVRSPGIPLNFP